MDSTTLTTPDALGGDELVSVIIPCYRQAHFLGQAIESVLAQTYRQHEVVVVDDGSPDDTRAVAACYPGIIYTHQANQGLSAARNAGFRHSRGQYLVFLDADDRLVRDALAQGIACFRAHPECAMVSGHYRLMRMDGTPDEDFAQTPLEGEPYLTLLERNYVGMNAAVMHRRAAFEAIGGFDTSLASCEDYELYMRMARSYPAFSYNAVVAEYRRYDHSMSMDPSVMMKGILAVFKAQWPLVQGNVAYLRAYRMGIRLNVDNAYRPLLGAIRRTLRRGHIARAVSLGLKLLKHPTLLPRALWLERCAALRLARDGQSPELQPREDRAGSTSG
jgi:glycosyltransferase involved in cell wall biosynthesis